VIAARISSAAYIERRIVAVIPVPTVVIITIVTAIAIAGHRGGCHERQRCRRTAQQD
jgi:hypothetical protein